MRRISTRASTLAFALALATSTLASGPAWAGGRKPDEAEAKRDELRSFLAEDPMVAAEQLWDAGEEHGDPELFLEGAELLLHHAEGSRDLEAARQAETMALVATDVAFYLADETNYKATNWRPVTRERAAQLSSEATATAAAARELVAEIEAEREAAEQAERERLAALAEKNKKRSLGPGGGMIIGGSVALVFAAGGAGMLAAGLAMGGSAQREADALDLPTELDRLGELDREGARANAIAGAGGAVAGVGLAISVALIVVGVKKKKKAGPGAEAGIGEHGLLVGGWVQRDAAGLSLRGSF